MEWVQVRGLRLRFLLLLLLTILAEDSVRALECVQEPGGLQRVTLPTGEIALYCKSQTMWSNGDTVVITRCPDKQVEAGLTCPELKPAPLNCDAMAVPNPSNSLVNHTFQVGTTTAGKYLTCMPPFAWISGLPGVLTQCANGTWTPVFDLCDATCTFPRDCSDIANLGFTASGEFDVVVTAKTTDPTMPVTCRLSEVKGDTGWTVVMRYAFPVTKPIPFSNKEPSGNFSDWNYFIGFNPLEYMGWNPDYTVRRMILRMEITLASGEVLFIEYSGFHLSNDNNYELQGLGSPHGTAGSILDGNYAQRPATDDIWWKCPTGTMCTSVSWDSMIIPVFGSPAVSHLVVLARPASFDAEVACPPVIKYPTWNWSSNRSMDMSRAPGSTANFTCAPYLFEGISRPPSERKTFANIVCLQGMGAPYWSFVPELPCKFVCPDGFTRIEGARKCLSPSTAPATGGVHGAALKCGANDTSLALVGTDGLPANLLTPEVFYYTGNAFNGTFDPALPDTFTCAAGEECTGNDTNPCLAVRVMADGKTQYRVQNCSRVDTNYLCMYPGMCPANFFFHEGLCYKVVPPVTTLTDLSDAIALCNDEGAVLAYPETMARLTFIEELIKAQDSYAMSQPANAVLALNDRQGDWTQQGLYTLDAEVMALAGTSFLGSNYRLLQVSDMAALKLIPVTLQPQVMVHYVACQLYGVRGCSGDPQLPGVNMVRNYNYTKNLQDKAIYSCFPGYFVGGNISMKAVEEVCVGELGGWTLNATLTTGLMCLGANVCPATSLPVPPSALITSVMGINHLWLNGTVSYSCPHNTTTASLNTTQNVTCTETVPDTYAYVPAALMPCNVCLGVPTVANGTTNHAAATSYTRGMTVTATCLPSHTYNALGNTTQIISCLETGWPAFLPCYKACLKPFPTPGTSMTQSPLTPNITIGTRITYTCVGAFKTLLPDNITLVASVTVTCSVTGEWDTAGPLPPCLHYCENEPMVASATTTWLATKKYAAGAQVNATCIANHVAGVNTTVQTLNCTAAGWTTGIPCVSGCLAAPPAAGVNMIAPPVLASHTGATLTYTCINDTFASVDLMLPPVTAIVVTCDASGLWVTTATTATTLPDCLFASTTQPVLPAGSTLSGAVPPYLAGDVLTQTCDAGYASGTGATSTQHTFDGTQWVPADPTFECLLLPSGVCVHVCIRLPSFAAAEVTM
ncbi:uncharacterized protein LOC126996423 isoform X2 [Eriocheir sinensis]|uniref:uncharacterized protein LOC126996423 isoform X2 n=1 Tax=Eriocheir sinensis TaxID=95602 RepID=UPI0021C62180|nr:uncharacterized protein LOC126996423 isoform X2 [Eriocheir sinensis]